MKIYLMSSSTKLTFWLNQMTRFCWIGRRIVLLNLAPSIPAFEVDTCLSSYAQDEVVIFACVHSSDRRRSKRSSERRRRW